MRKGFKFIPQEDVVTHVYDAVSCTIPDQSLGLREMLMQFAYISGEKLSEIVNRGYDGDEDDDVLGVDASSMDFAELHDRYIDIMIQKPAPAPVSAPTQPNDEQVSAPAEQVADA